MNLSYLSKGENNTCYIKTVWSMYYKYEKEWKLSNFLFSQKGENVT